jgi:hypothetical protein
MTTLSQHKLYRNHDFDSAFSELYDIYKRNFLPLFLLSLAGNVILNLLFYYLGKRYMDWTSIAGEGLHFPDGFFSALLLMMLAALLIYTFLYLAMVCYVLRKQQGEGSSAIRLFGQSGRYFFRYLLLVVLVSLIIGAGTVLGILALVVGSLLALVYLTVSLFVAGPALVHENIDAGSAVGRSFVLTHRDFWMSLGLVVVLYLIIMLIQFILTAIVSLPGAVVFLSKLLSGGELTEVIGTGGFPGLWGWGLTGIFFSSLVSALVLPLTPIFSVILYYKLKYVENEL